MEQTVAGDASVAPSGPARPGTRLHSLQYLRAIAAIMVAIFHSASQIPAYTPYLYHPRLATGVDVFFVISGFIMAVTGARLSPREFAVRRLVRIVPLYWLLTTLLALMALLLPQVFKTTVVTPGAYVLSMLFVPFRNTGQQDVFRPLLSPGWTLNYEMFFYGVFALVLWLKPGRLALHTGLILGAFVLSGLIHPTFYTSPIILEFWLGIVIAHAYRHVSLSMPASLALVAAGFTGLMATDLVAVHLVAAGAAVLGAVSWERSGRLPVWRPGVALGDASYSIYLIHIFVLGLTRVLWDSVFASRGHAEGAAGFALFSTLAVLAASLACYRWVEAPMSAALHRICVAPWSARARIRPSTAA